MPLDTKRVDKNIRKLRKMLKKASKLPDPENVYKLRTRTRRLEATIEALGLASKNNGRILLRELRRIRKKAGKVRDMDVLTSHLFGVRLDNDKDCLVQLLEYLGAKRYRYARRLHRSMRHHGAEIRQRLRRTEVHLKQIEKDGRKKGSRPPGEMDTTAAAAVLQLSRGLNTPPSLNRGNLHAYRMKVKELRYVLQTNPNNTTQELRELIDQLDECKDAIGEWHDWQELEKKAAKLLRNHPNCEMRHRLSAIQREKYESALSITNRMRRKYVTPNVERRHSSRRRQRPPEPILKAAAAFTN
jgi:CHAD domain-containing protein